MAKSAAKTQPKQWLLRIALLLVAFILVVYAAQAFFIPRIVRSRVSEALATLGLSNASFKLRNATLFGTELERIEGGEGLLNVQSVQLEYGPSIAATGRLRAVRLRGADLRLSIRNNQLDLSQLTPTTAKSSSGNGEFPFDRLELASSTLRLDWDDRTWWLPISGEVVNNSGQLDIAMRTFAHGSPVDIYAKIPRGSSAATDVSVVVAAPTLNVASLISSLPPALFPATTHLGGQADLKVEYTRQSGKQSIGLSMSPRDFWVQSVGPAGVISASQIDGTLHADLDDRFAVRSITADLRGQRLFAGGQLLTNLNLRAHSTGDIANLALSGAGESWKVNRLEADITGLLGQTAISNVQTALRYDVSGRPPKEVMDALLKRGVNAQKLGELQIAGEGVAAASFPAPPTTAVAATSAPSTQPAEPWRFQTSKTRVSLQPGRLDMTAGGGANVEGLAGVLDVEGTVTPSSTTIILHDESWLSMQSMQAGGTSADGKTAALAATAMHLALHPDRELPVLQATFSEAGWRADIALGASADESVGLLFPGAQVNTGQLKVGARLNATPFGKPVLNADAIFTNAKVTHAASGLVLDKIYASIPIAWNGRQREMQQLKIESIKVGDETYPPITGSSRVLDGKAELDVSWLILPEVVLAAHGTLAAGSQGIDADLRANVPGFTIKDPAELAKRIPALAGVDITGTFAADANVTVRGGLVAPQAGIAISNAKVEDKSRTLLVDGISGGVKISSLSPFQTEGGQTLKIKTFTKGDMKLSDGTIALRVERPDSILIEGTDWAWAGGRIFSNSFRINPARPNVDIMLFADGLNVGHILDEFAKGKATGAGELYGRIPVSIRWPAVTFGEGFLYARPGVEGELAFTDTQAVESLLAQSDPRLSQKGELSQVKDRIVGAMRDFQYDLFRVDLSRDHDALLAKIDVHGQGKTGPKPQELYMTFNVRGFEALLNTYLALDEKLSNVQLKEK